MTDVQVPLLQANTIRLDYVDRGILHVEGGWPKDVNQDDPEQVTRFKKKAEKEEIYLQSVLKMSKVSDIHFQIPHGFTVFYCFVYKIILFNKV